MPQDLSPLGVGQKWRENSLEIPPTTNLPCDIPIWIHSAAQDQILRETEWMEGNLYGICGKPPQSPQESEREKKGGKRSELRPRKLNTINISSLRLSPLKSRVI